MVIYFFDNKGCTMITVGAVTVIASTYYYWHNCRYSIGTIHSAIIPVVYKHKLVAVQQRSFINLPPTIFEHPYFTNRI
jgi:hypothetical protein